ncbi:MAG: hypothetical protein R2729_17025 [Bryobacteraceae bacterium]
MVETGAFGNTSSGSPQPASNQQFIAAPLDPPLGTAETQVDERGRIRIPADFARFLHRLDSDFFVTSLDTRVLHIFGRHNWLERGRLLQNQSGEVAAAAQDILFIANHYGASATMDGQFRMLLPERLREKLSLKGTTVWLQAAGDRLNGYTHAAYQERLVKAEENVTEKAARLAALGLI